MLNQKGKMTLTGESFLRRTDGGVVTCAGQAVKLFPVTAYASERMRYIYGGTQQGYRSAMNFQLKPLDFTPDEQMYHVYEKKTFCDAQGHFKFSDMKPGKYYILTDVVWGPLPNRYYYEGVIIMQQIDLQEDNQHFIFTR